MELQHTEYELIEYVEDEEESAFLTGTITIKDGKVVGAEVIDCTIFRIDDVERIREFLNIVESKIVGDENE